MLAIIAPGQGAQTPGMLNSWITDPQLKTLLSKWSATIDLDLERLGTNADAEEIKDTANAQPLIVATSLLSFQALKIENFALVSGHSVGELVAASISGAITFDDAMKIVRARGLEMAKAAAITPAGMSAILGGDRSEVLAAIGALNLIPANDNGAGQIVAAGDLESLAKLAENPPASARVRALAVAGAFHTSFMQTAVAPLAELAKEILTIDPTTRVVSNKDGQEISNGREILDRIVNQIATPVRWDLCMQSLKNNGITGVIELAPAGTLVGLIKRAVPEIEGFALKSAEDLTAAREFAGRHQ